jgi:hypothetical protein
MPALFLCGVLIAAIGSVVYGIPGLRRDDVAAGIDPGLSPLQQIALVTNTLGRAADTGQSITHYQAAHRAVVRGGVMLHNYSVGHRPR